MIRRDGSSTSGPDATEMKLQAIRDYYVGLREQALTIKTSGHDRTRGDRRADIRSRWSSTRTAIHDFYQLLVQDVVEPIDTSFQQRCQLKVELRMDLPDPAEPCLSGAWWAVAQIGNREGVALMNQIEDPGPHLSIPDRDSQKNLRNMLLSDIRHTLGEWLTAEFDAIAEEAALDKPRREEVKTHDDSGETGGDHH